MLPFITDRPDFKGIETNPAKPLVPTTISLPIDPISRGLRPFGFHPFDEFGNITDRPDFKGIETLLFSGFCPLDG